MSYSHITPRNTGAVKLGNLVYSIPVDQGDSISISRHRNTRPSEDWYKPVDFDSEGNAIYGADEFHVFNELHLARNSRGKYGLEFFIGGNLTRFHSPRALMTPAGAQPIRGVITEFSKKSRQTLINKLNSLNRDKIDVQGALMFTLTYPGVWPDDPREWKRHLEAFRKRMRRAWGKTPGFWKLEPQRRGAPHFHLLLFFQASELQDLGLDRLQKWVSLAWFEVVGSGDERHLRAGTRVEKIRTWNGVTSYASKYLGKECSFRRKSDEGELETVGRFWGVWCNESLPVNRSQSEVLIDALQWIRRTERRYCESKGQKVHFLNKRRNSCVYAPSSIVEQCLRYLGPSCLPDHVAIEPGHPWFSIFFPNGYVDGS